MTSARKVAANRNNGRKSRGPRTAAGKVKASRNALRHGLSTISYDNPAVAPDIEQMAKAICAGDPDPLLFEQAVQIAETALVLRCVSAERVAVIERLRKGTAIALAKGDNSMALAKATVKESELAWDELDRIRARFGIIDEFAPPHVYDEMERLPPQPGWKPTTIAERDETDALCEAVPDLERLARYERRALSRRKRALERFIEIKQGAVDRVPRNR